MGWFREKEWAMIVANRKEKGGMLITDDTFDCLECGATIGYDDYIQGDESECCPFCGEYIVPYR